MTVVETGPLWPFSPRNGSDLGPTIETLLNEPEIVLDDEVRRQVDQFAHELFARDTLPSLETVSGVKASNDMAEIYTDYFATPEGREELWDMGLGNAVTPAAVSSMLFAAVGQESGPDKKQIEALGNHSRDWYIDLLKQRLVDDVEIAAAGDSDVLHVNTAPENLLKKLEWAQAYRGYYREVRRQLKKTEDSPLTEAKSTLLDVHVAKINSTVALLYPQALQFARQLSESPRTDQVEKWERRLFAALPVVGMVFGGKQADHADFTRGAIRRMDLVRNGADHLGGHDYTPISRELISLAAELDSDRNASGKAPTPKLPAEVLQKLHETTWGDGELKTFVDAVLEEMDLLSAEKVTWSELKENFVEATDSKWRTIITSTVTSLTTEGRIKAVLIPEKTKRTLSQVDPAGALPVSVHELAHVLQEVFDGQLAQSIPLARVKGSRHLTTREMGGIIYETDAQNDFGQSRPVRTSYLRALQTKLSGGNQTAVARAFMASRARGEVMDDKQRAARAKSAGSTVLRLYRHGGQNSQPLDYLEQELLVRSLAAISPERLHAIGLAAGSFSIKHMAALHRVDLLDVPEQVNYDPKKVVMQVFMEKFYNELGAV